MTEDQVDPELLKALDPDAPLAEPDKGDDRSRGDLPRVGDGIEGEQQLVPGGPLTGGDTTVTADLEVEDQT